MLKFKAYKHKNANDVICNVSHCIKGKTFTFDGFYNFNMEVFDGSGTKNIIYPGYDEKIKLGFKYFSRLKD